VWHGDCSNAKSEVALWQVVLVKDVETTLCSTYERWAAFEAAMGGGGGAADDAGSSSGVLRRPLVLLGGCGLSLATATAPQPRSAVDERCHDSPAACPAKLPHVKRICCFTRSVLGQGREGRNLGSWLLMTLSQGCMADGTVVMQTAARAAQRTATMTAACTGRRREAARAAATSSRRAPTTRWPACCPALLSWGCRWRRSAPTPASEWAADSGDPVSIRLFLKGWYT
jgi:hypothetical protein